MNAKCRILLVTIATFFIVGGVEHSGTVLGQGAFVGHPAAHHVGPDKLYPDAGMTPGKADTVAVADLTDSWECPESLKKQTCTYSQSHRSVSSKTHTTVYEEYSVPAAQRNAKFGEVDHFDPLCNGGANDLKNLWYQPATNAWNGKNFGYHEKDALEDWVCKQVKAGMLDPKEAFTKLTSDWVAYYQEVNPKNTKFRD